MWKPCKLLSSLEWGSVRQTCYTISHFTGCFPEYHENLARHALEYKPELCQNSVVFSWHSIGILNLFEVGTTYMCLSLMLFCPSRHGSSVSPIPTSPAYRFSTYEKVTDICELSCEVQVFFLTSPRWINSRPATIHRCTGA